MSATKPKARLFVQKPLGHDGQVILEGQQAHYLSHVMRATTGEAILLFNGRDGEWLARISTQGRQRCALDVVLCTRPQQPDRGPWLLFAPLKKSATDFLIEKATELGAARLWPIMTKRTVVTRVNLERIQSNVIEAAEQCERLSVPRVMAPANVSALSDVWPSERPLLVLSEHGDGMPIAEALGRRRATDAPLAAGFLTGPEGGFTGSELDELARLPFVTAVSAGPRILRAETAAVAALVCWQALVGDWYEPPPPRNRIWKEA